jgi:glycosyltransferase involved in cell wall biosynthesis
LDHSKTELGLINVIGDVLSGQQGTTDPAMLRYFSDIVERIAPDALQLEQPFMWPVAKQLRQVSGGRKPLLIYSSHNVETPLKRAILVACGMPSEKRDQICFGIEEMEAEIAREADLIVCVSEEDREYYRCELKSTSPVIVVRNGVDRPEKCVKHQVPAALSSFQDQPYLMTVASAHIPTIEGLRHYMLNGGLFCVPPTPSIAICGGIAKSIRDHPEYQRYRAANDKRVRFFADVSDSELSAIKQDCHGVLLPIHHGGGTNLKTAEALALGKWVVATSTALRGFERFLSTDGVVIADNPTDFRHAMRQVLQRSPFELSDASRTARDALYWDRCFDDGDLPKFFGDAQRPASPPNSQERFDQLDTNSGTAGGRQNVTWETIAVKSLGR